MINEKQYDKIKQYEKHFSTAVNSGFVVALPSNDAMNILEVYTSLGYPAKKINCHKCVFEMVKTVGNEYFKFKNSIVQVDSGDVSTEPNKTILKDKNKQPKKKNGKNKKL